MEQFQSKSPHVYILLKWYHLHHPNFCSILQKTGSNKVGDVPCQFVLKNCILQKMMVKSLLIEYFKSIGSNKLMKEHINNKPTIEWIQRNWMEIACTNFHSHSCSVVDLHFIIYSSGVEVIHSNVSFSQLVISMSTHALMKCCFGIYLVICDKYEKLWTLSFKI